jgi:hypothetical protein
MEAISSVFPPVSRETVRKNLIDYANYLRESVFWKLKGKSVSLIADGATWESRALYFVVAFTPRNIYFLDVMHLESTDHLAIANEMGKLVKKLNDGGTIVWGVTTDNAANLVRALDPEELRETLQTVTGRKILHVRCGIHTAHLVFSDLEKESLIFPAFKDYVTKLLSWLRKPEQRVYLRAQGVEGKIPRIEEMKWCKYSDGAAFLELNKELINEMLPRSRDAPFLCWTDEYSEVFKAVATLSRFIRRSEGDHICLPELYDNYVAMIEELKELSGEKDSFAQHLSRLVTKRIYETADGYLAELADIFTPVGFAWFAARRAKLLFQGERSEELIRENSQTVDEIRAMRTKLRSISIYLYDNAKDIGIVFDDYLQGTGPNPSMLLLEWWLEYGNTSFQDPNPLSSRNGPKQYRRFRFGEIADILLQLPGTEAVCERLVSHFEALFPKSRNLAKDDLLVAQMTIRMFESWQGKFKDPRRRRAKRGSTRTVRGHDCYTNFQESLIAN